MKKQTSAIKFNQPKQSYPLTKNINVGDQDALRQKQMLELQKLQDKKFQRPANFDSIDVALREIENQANNQNPFQNNQTIISGISSLPLSKLGMKSSITQLMSAKSFYESEINNKHLSSIMRRQDRRMSRIGAHEKDSSRILVMTKKQQALLKFNQKPQPRKIKNFKDQNQLYGPQCFIKRQERQSLWFGLDPIQQADLPVYNDIPFLIDQDNPQTKKNLMSRNLQKGHSLFTNFKRVRKGINKLFPMYHLYSQHGIYLASAKKMIGNMTSNYHFSTQDDNFDSNNPNYIGKVRSNFIGNYFNIYSQGMNPKQISDTNQQIRKLLATVYYNNQSKIREIPRQMEVYVLEEDIDYSSLKGAPEMFKKEEVSLKQLYELGNNKTKISRFINKAPVFHKQIKGYYLDLHGKSHIPSVKNFILKRDSYPYEEVLLCAKVDQDDYHVDITHPISPRIALGILISSFDFKISLE